MKTGTKKKIIMRGELDGQKRKIIEWHPAFEASIQIEFENEIEKK